MDTCLTTALEVGLALSKHTPIIALLEKGTVMFLNLLSWVESKWSFGCQVMYIPPS